MTADRPGGLGLARVCDVSLREGLQSGLRVFAHPHATAEYVQTVLGSRFAQEVELYRPGRHLAADVFDEVVALVGWSHLRLYCGPLDRFAAADQERLPTGVRRVSFTVVREREEAKALHALRLLRSRRPDVAVRLGFECADASAIATFLRGYQDLHDGDSVALCDSAGRLGPEDVGRLVRVVRDIAPGLEIEGHFHNDRGLALSNWLALRDLGGASCDATLGGIGERSGVLALETVLGELVDRDLFPQTFTSFERLRRLAGADEIARHVPIPFTRGGRLVAESHLDDDRRLRDEYAHTYLDSQEAR